MKYLAGESQRTVDLASSMLGARRRMRGLRKNRTEVITEPYFAVQNDYIQKIYQVTSNGRLREVPQEEYVLSAWEEVELRQDITLYRTPDGDETFVLPKGSKVRMTKLDATQDWICIEITDGVKGWFRLQDGKDYSDYFSGLYFAG